MKQWKHTVLNLLIQVFGLSYNYTYSGTLAYEGLKFFMLQMSKRFKRPETIEKKKKNLKEKVILF